MRQVRSPITHAGSSHQYYPSALEEPYPPVFAIVAVALTSCFYGSLPAML